MVAGIGVAFAEQDFDRLDAETAVFGQIVVGSCGLPAVAAIGPAEVGLGDVAAAAESLGRKERPWLAVAVAVAAASERYPEIGNAKKRDVADWADETSATGRMPAHTARARPAVGICQRVVALVRLFPGNAIN